MEALSKEGESGRKKLNNYTRWLTLPLAFLQSYGMILLLNSQSQIPIIDGINNPAVILPIMLTISAGTILLVWIGEQISEKGIGNGISLLIFAGIISSIPQLIGQGLFLAQEDQSKLVPLTFIILITVMLITLVVLVNEGVRRIPITYAGQKIRGAKDQAFFPVRINQVGMIPIIFAVALVSFPGILGQFLANATSPWLRDIGASLTQIFLPNTITYLVIYVLLIIAFTFFYVTITFNPDQIAESIQKRGGYIPGIRPGTQTSTYLKEISFRLTFCGAIFLAFIAALPLMLQFVFTTSGIGSVPLLISGAGIIIIVGVVLELIRQINAQLVMHDYQKFF